MFNVLKEKIHKVLNIRVFLAMLSLIAFIFGSFVYFGQRAKRNAIGIFNSYMASQKIMEGKIEVGDLDPHLDGTVNFENLIWRNLKDEPLLKVAKGTIRVSPLDIILKKAGARSINKVVLDRAEFILHFNENNKADIVSKERVEQGKIDVAVKPKDTSNIQIQKQIGRKHLVIINSTITIIDRNRIYALNNVDGDCVYDNGLLNLKLKTGKFGGSLEGDGLEMEGQVNTLPGKDNLDINYKLHNVVPSSLGIGNIHNNVSLDGKAKGTIKNTIIDGNIYFPSLDLPKMHFTNVSGKYHYDDNVIYVMDVTANIFGGRVDVFGDYNFKSRAHKIFIQGRGLQADQYFKVENIHCSLDLDMEMLNDGTKYGTVYRGFFKSGEGRYDKHNFHTLSAFFKIEQKDLHFTRIVLDTNIGEFHASNLDVVNKKMKIHGLSWHPHHRVKRHASKEEQQREREEIKKEKEEKKHNKPIRTPH